MDGTLNVMMLVVLILSGAMLLAYWLSPSGCASIGRYFTARSVALPRKRKTLLDARIQYRRDMEALRSKVHQTPRTKAVRRKAEVTELKRGKA